jgi:hypothetical protein
MNFLRISTLSAAITSFLVFIIYVKDFVFAYIHDVEFSYTFLAKSITLMLLYLALAAFFIALFLSQKSNAQ